MAWSYDKRDLLKQLGPPVKFADLPRDSMTIEQARVRWRLKHRNSVIRYIQVGRVEARQLDDGTIFVLTQHQPEAEKPGRKPKKAKGE